MKELLKTLLLAIVLGLGFTSCTAEQLDDDSTKVVATDPEKEDLYPPAEPND
ncbi:hypothetical protein [Algibacter sp. 2305UL17-15]|uniref:hypothetical protein n=1 Tax=Algibacter sp. 2305UL17-15 TaxID=3231268 RepID=UPI00345B077C